MVDCRYKSSLEAYHDGELPPEQAQDIERHLTGCQACLHDLQRIRELSQLVASGRPEAIRADELARIHDAIEGVQNRSLFRFAAAMSAIAASILIISAAWLYDATPQRNVISQIPQTEHSWERLASTGQIELPAGAPETGLAERDTANWMAVSLGDGGGHGNQ
jgi:anti-sigma factor RsiW